MLIDIKKLFIILISFFLMVSCEWSSKDVSGLILDGKVTVTFNSQGGSYINNQTIEKGSYIIEPGEPVRPTYTFSGWYKETTCANSWNFSSDKIESDLTLYAKWDAVSPNNLSDFYLINSYTISSALNIIYNKSYSGTITYIVSRNDLGITSKDQFNASTATKITKSITADDLIYDDYITTGSQMNGTKYYVYLLDNTSGEVKSLSRTTETNSGYTQESGTIDGSASGGSIITYTIYFPHDYDASSSKTWPFILSVKAPDFVSSNNNFPCIVFNTDVSGAASVLLIDTENVKNKVKAIIENPAYKIDKSRLYTIGFSAGGCAALVIANNDGSDQYKFKAVAGVGVSSWLGNSTYCSNLGGVHIWLFHGENDTTYGPQTVTAYNGIKTNTPGRTGDILLTEMPGTGHDANPAWASPYTFMWLLSK
jgi:uncharacterized repeat protein (TIGR02543 family)